MRTHDIEDPECVCSACIAELHAEVARERGEGLACTGFLGCACRECRAEAEHLAAWNELETWGGEE